eukprot:5750974-Prymnesium_polylepis.1
MQWRWRRASVWRPRGKGGTWEKRGRWDEVGRCHRAHRCAQPRPGDDQGAARVPGRRRHVHGLRPLG